MFLQTRLLASKTVLSVHETTLHFKIFCSCVDSFTWLRGVAIVDKTVSEIFVPFLPATSCLRAYAHANTFADAHVRPHLDAYVFGCVCLFIQCRLMLSFSLSSSPRDQGWSETLQSLHVNYGCGLLIQCFAHIYLSMNFLCRQRGYFSFPVAWFLQLPGFRNLRKRSQ